MNTASCCNKPNVLFSWTRDLTCEPRGEKKKTKERNILTFLMRKKKDGRWRPVQFSLTRKKEKQKARKVQEVFLSTGPTPFPTTQSNTSTWLSTGQLPPMFPSDLLTILLLLPLSSPSLLGHIRCSLMQAEIPFVHLQRKLIWNSNFSSQVSCIIELSLSPLCLYKQPAGAGTVIFYVELRRVPRVQRTFSPPSFYESFALGPLCTEAFTIFMFSSSCLTIGGMVRERESDCVCLKDRKYWNRAFKFKLLWNIKLIQKRNAHKKS